MVNETAQHGEHGQRPRTVTIKVNFRPVVLDDHKASGTEIKTAAIAQGVNIQQDFVLYIVQGGGKLKRVPDDEVITVHENQEFRAIAPDDNS